MKALAFATSPVARTIYPMRFLLAFAQGGLLSPLLPLFRETFHVSPGELGLLTSMAGLSSVVMDLVATALLRRRALPTLLLQGIGLTMVALCCSMLAPGFYWLVATQMLLGFGVGLTRVAALTVVVTATPLGEQGRANNLLECSAIAGTMLSPTLSGLLAALVHWRLAFGMAAIMVSGAFGWLLYTRQSLASAVEATTLRRTPQRLHATDRDTPAEAPHSQPRHARVIWMAYSTTFVLSFVWSGFLSNALPLFGGEVLHGSTSMLGLVFTVGLLADLLLLMPIGWLSDRLEARLVITPAMLLMAVALAYLPSANSLGGLFLVSITLHASFAAWGMPSAVLALCVPREQLARTMGIYRLLVDSAVVVAPWLVGTLIGLHGYGLPTWLSALGVGLMACLVWQGLRVPPRRAS